MHTNGTLNGRLPVEPSKPGRSVRPKRTAADKAREQLRTMMYSQLSGTMLSLGGYENATATRLRPGSSTVRGGSADSHRDEHTRDSLRRSCQQLDRNNVLARGLVQRLIDMTVGDGFVLRVQTEDTEWNTRAEALFNDWAQNRGDFADGNGIDIRGRSTIDDFAAEAVRCACVDGDLGGIKTIDGQIQMVEAERIRNEKGMGLDGRTPRGTLMIGGVEMDGAGRPLQYHIASWSGAMGAFVDFTTQAVPAAAFIFLANPIRTITGSTRGEPQLQASLARFEHLDGFDEAVRVAARIQAILSAFIVVERPDMHQEVFPGTIETQQNEDDEDQETKVDELEPGMLNRLRPGESIQTVASTQPGPDYESFVLMQVVQICADLGLPLPLALLDGRQVNLSSIRSVLQFAWRNFERWQEWLRCRWYSNVYRWRVAMFIRDGLLPMPSGEKPWDAHAWLSPPPPVMDPKVEVEAARALVDGCFESRSGVMQRVWGREFTSVLAELAEEQKAFDKAGVKPSAAPGAAPTETASSKPDDKEGDEAEDKDSEADQPAASENT